MFANISKYSRFVLKREKIMSAVWVASIILFTLFIAAAYPGLFPTPEALAGMAATMDTPAMTAMMGPVYGLDAMTVSIAMAQECLIWFALAVIIMNIFFVNRYTRADEELGRLEMFTALPVGRLTNSAAAVIFSFGLNVLISVLTAAVLLAINMAGTTVAGAFAYGFSIGMQGFVFAAVTLLMAQLFSTARGSLGASAAIMGLAYVLRAQGDMAGNALSYISPLGLGLKVQAFYADNFVPVVVLFIEAVAIISIAMVINARRDIGMGVFPARKGRAEASRFFRSPLGFAWRLSRNGFIAWAAGVLLIGMTYGSVTGELDTFVKGNEIMSQMIGGTGEALADAFVAMLCGIMTIIMTIPVVNCVNRIYAEEKRGRMEQILAAAVPRVKLYGSFVFIAVLESVAFNVLCTLGFYAAAQSSGLIEFKTVFYGMILYVPAMLLMLGLAACLVGFLPKFTSLIWVVFGGSFLLFYFGRILQLPDWTRRLSPYGNTPQYPMEEVTAMPLIILAALAAVLIIAGAVGYRRRDA